MSKANFYNALKLVMYALLITSCIEENLEVKLPTPKGDEVVFGARAGFEYADTKTIYDGNGDLGYYEKDGKTFEGISWDYAKDRIQIYCPQSPIEYSHYKVMEGDGYAYLERSGDASIQWKNDTDGHDFYAMYPSNEMFEGDSEVNVTLRKGVQMDRTTLTGTVPISQNPKEIKRVSKEGGKNKYIAVPNMDFAYMAAKTTGVTKYNKDGKPQSVSLTFIPIVTTVQIELSMASTSLIQPVSIGEIYIEGTNIAGSFSANLADWDSTYPACNLVGSGSNKISVSTWQKDEEGNLIPLTLQPNESLVLTVFLNPGAKQIEDLKVTISETGGVGLGKNMTGLKLQPHIKTVIEKLMLPAQGITVENSKWVELMPDETSLKALSIPGTGNSFSMNVASEVNRSQKLSFAQQWNLGIRAFEITTDRPNASSAKGSPYFSEEYVKCNGESAGITVTNVFNDIKNLLSQFPNEFAMVILNYQSEGSDPGRDISLYAQEVVEFYDEYTKAYREEKNDQNAELFKLYSPNLTLDDVRGKIMLVMRTNQEDEDSAEEFAAVKTAIGEKNILAVNGCGSGKDKWRRRGYSVSDANGNNKPAYNIWDNFGNDYIAEGVLIEDYMVGYSSSETGQITWINDSWEDVKIPDESYGGNFSYDCTTGNSSQPFKIWFQEWARVVPEPENGQDYTTYLIGRCRTSNIISTSYRYYHTRWPGSYNEKLRNAKYAFQQAIAGGNVNDISHVFINSLCGYFVTSNDKSSCTPWMQNPDDGHSHGLVGSSLSWPTGGISGDIPSLASKLNNDFYNYVLNSGFEQATGPTGVVMMDMVSNSSADGGSYYLPGVIIGNNFKYDIETPKYPAGSAEVEDWESVELN